MSSSALLDSPAAEDRSYPMREFAPAGVHTNTEILYFDGSIDEAAQAVDISSFDLEEQLEAHGFVKVGSIACQPLKCEINPYNGDDAEEFDDYMTAGSVNGVLVAPDGTAFAEPEFAHGAVSLRFRTLFPSGDIVETRLIPSREPKRASLAELTDCESPSDCDDAADEWLNKLLQTGDEELHPSFPKAGLWRRSFREPNVARLWRHHQEWVAEMQRELKCRPVVHRDLDQFLQITRRGWHVGQWHNDWSLRLAEWAGWVIGLMALLVIVPFASSINMSAVYIIGLLYGTSLVALALRHTFMPDGAGLTAAPLGMLLAWICGQPIVISGLLVVAFQVFLLLRLLLVALLISRRGVTLARIFRGPPRVPANQLAVAYPDPRR